VQDNIVDGEVDAAVPASAADHSTAQEANVDDHPETVNANGSLAENIQEHHEFAMKKPHEEQEVPVEMEPGDSMMAEVTDEDSAKVMKEPKRLVEPTVA
jgi:hypothetical protein